MNIIFMTNSEFSIPSLEKLKNSNHTIMNVVTNPNQKVGRQKNNGSIITLKCEELGIKIIEQNDLNNNSFEKTLRKFQPDLFVIVAYRILPKSLLNIPKLGSINLHGSLLPCYRGAAPIQWSLINGDKQTGLSIFFIEPKVDTGALISQKKIEILDYDNYGSLKSKMALKGAKLLLDAINLIDDRKISPIKQNEGLVTYAPKITKEMTHINWDTSATRIHNFIRGLTPVPGAQSRINGKHIKIQETYIINNYPNNSTFNAGQISDISKDKLLIQTGDGQLSIIRLQLEGKRSLDIKSFLNGYPLKVGAYFGS